VRPSRAANNDPHPRALGALALSLMRGRGILEMDKETEKEGLKRQRASYAKALKKGRAPHKVPPWAARLVLWSGSGYGGS
jgi:hypothetical protein